MKTESVYIYIYITHMNIYTYILQQCILVHSGVHRLIVHSAYVCSCSQCGSAPRVHFLCSPPQASSLAPPPGPQAISA